MVHQEIGAKDVVAIVRRRFLLIFLLAALGGILGFAARARFTEAIYLEDAGPRRAARGSARRSDRHGQRQPATGDHAAADFEHGAPGSGDSRSESVSAKISAVCPRKRSSTTCGKPSRSPRRAHDGDAGAEPARVHDQRCFRQSSTRAKNLLDDYDHVHRGRHEGHARGTTSDTTKFLNKQLDQAKTKLDEQDAKLAAFQRRTPDRSPKTASRTWLS